MRVIEWRDGTSQICCLNPETQAAVNGIDTVGWMLSANALWTSREPETFSGLDHNSGHPSLRQPVAAVGRSYGRSG
ncbi:hypothetical protein, partial [uncultured Lamprocystis sp.]